MYFLILILRHILINNDLFVRSVSQLFIAFYCITSWWSKAGSIMSDGLRSKSWRLLRLRFRLSHLNWRTHKLNLGMLWTGLSSDTFNNRGYFIFFKLSHFLNYINAQLHFVNRETKLEEMAELYFRFDAKIEYGDIHYLLHK